MLAFALGVGAVGDALGGGWIAGLKLAAVAVVANALVGMARNLCPDRSRASFAVAALAVVVVLPGVWGQIGAILAAGLAGRLLLTAQAQEGVRGELPVFVGRTTALACLALFVLLLAGLPLAAALGQGQALALVDLLPYGRAGVRRRSRDPAAASGAGGAGRSGRGGDLPRRLRRGAGAAGAAVQLLGVSGRGGGRRRGWRAGLIA